MKMVPLGEIAQINPRLPKSVRSGEEYAVSFLPMAAVLEDGTIAEEEMRPLSEVLKGYTYFERDDVIFAKITPCFENGKAAHLVNLGTQVGFGSTEFHVLRPGHHLDARYLFHMVWNPRFRFMESKKMAGAAGQKRVPVDAVRDYKIPLLPLPEQKRIAAILDKADTIRRKRRQALALADQFLRSVFLDMFGDPVTNPKGWEIGTIRDLVSDVRYGTSKKADISQGAFPVLRMGNITYAGGLDISDLKYVDLDEREQPKYLATHDDILFNRTNSKELVGKTAVYDLDEPMAIAGYLVRARVNENADPYYIASYLNSDHGKATLMGMCKNIVGMANINAQEMQDIRIAHPPVELQYDYRRVVEAVKKDKGLHLAGIDEAEHLFGSLTQRAFRGEL